jgi:nitric oxide reductase subunit B
MNMSLTQQAALRLFSQTIMLLIVWALAALLAAAQFLSPDAPLARALPYQQISALANVLLHLAALTGLLAGGVYIAVGERVLHAGLLRYTSWLWTALLILALLAGLLNILEGRQLLELPPLLDVLLIIVLLAFALNVLLGARQVPAVQVWSIGLLLSAGCTLIGLLPTGDYLADRALRALATGLNLYVALPLAAVALGFWLMHRFSNVTPAWTQMGIYTIAGLVTLAGTLVNLTPLHTLGAPEWTRTLGGLALFIVPLSYLIYASHSYRALADRNATYTFAAHWYALALLLYLLGIGLLGGVQAAPSVSAYTLGTRLSDLQSTLALLAPLAMALGVINQATAELRGSNQRVTGLSPFWLVAFGAVGSALALGAAGVAQVFLERRLSIGYLDTQNLLTPLYAGWVFGLLLLALGVGIYAFSFWRRRPVHS